MTDATISTWAPCDHLISAPDGEQGYIVTVEQLLDVEGIGEGLLEKLRPYVYVEESE